MPNQYFVIGGKYRDLDFNELIEGTSHVLGPYQAFEEAQRIWKERSVESRSEACTRYAIVKNAADPRRTQQTT